MLRKSQERIFAYIRRQVHAIACDNGAFLTLQRNMTNPILQLEIMIELLEAPHTFAAQGQADRASDEQTAIQLLNLKIVVQWLVDMDDLIQRLKIKFFDIQSALQGQVFVLQVAEIYE